MTQREAVTMNQFGRRNSAFQQIDSSQLQYLDALRISDVRRALLPAAAESGSEKISIKLKSSNNFTQAVFEHSQVS